MSARLQELLIIMARLRAPDGCPWDREQSFASIAPYTIEEAYEVADAIQRGDLEDLRDELGDLLLQVVFHAQMASEAGHFDFDGVAAAICEKLIRRHPHVFRDVQPGLTAADQSRTWEDIKAEERRANGVMAAVDAPNAPNASNASKDTTATAADRAMPPSHLDNVPLALPALMRAHKLSRRAAHAGFDFEAAEQAAAKVAEELAEVRAAAAQNTAAAPSAQMFEEIGDLLFAATNLARKLDIDAEAALRAANAKFERRFRGMESLAAARGVPFERLDLIAQEKLWQEMKRRE
jgi:MazG family protein